jgi:hypothetical protein
VKVPLEPRQDKSNSARGPVPAVWASKPAQHGERLPGLSASCPATPSPLCVLRDRPRRRCRAQGLTLPIPAARCLPAVSP